MRTLQWADTPINTPYVLQVITQNDKQFLLLVSPNGNSERVPLDRPQDVPESAFRFASLKRLVRLGNGALLLYLLSDGVQDRPSVLMCVDPKRGKTTWHHRSACTEAQIIQHHGNILAALFSPGNAITLVHLKVPGDPTQTPSARTHTIEVPADMRVCDVLPADRNQVLATHPLGISRWTEETHWTLLMPAPPSEMAFLDTPSRLCMVGPRILWQPCPGTLYEVAAEGPPLSIPLPPPPEPFTLDQGLLTLAGVDGEGSLWLTLTRPTLASATPTTAPTPTAQVGEEGWKDEEAKSVRPAEALQVHLSQPLDRLYRWKLGKPMPAPQSWQALAKSPQAPSWIQGFAPRLLPQRGDLLFGDPGRCWWVPAAQVPPAQPLIQLK